MGADPASRRPHRAAGPRLEGRFGTGKGGDAVTGGLEGIWSATPTKWSNNFFSSLFGCEWELTKSPAGAHQWKPKNGAGAGTVPDAHDPSKDHAPSMLTTDLALRFDPDYEKEGTRARREGPLHAGAHGCVAGADGRRVLCAARADR
jgi:catalase-peroxidase